MGDGTSSANLWHGIPLSQVRSAFFIDALRTAHTMKTLIHNNIVEEFHAAADGAVSLDGSYLNWIFICPIGVFSTVDFEGKTIGQFYDTIIAYTSENEVNAWEDFADFVGPHRSTINSMFGNVISAEITAPNMTGTVPFTSIPQFPVIDGFSNLVAWIKSIMPPAVLLHPASEMQTDAGGGQYSFGVNLLMTVNNGSETEEAAMNFSFVL